jgi:hypothetical protein
VRFVLTPRCPDIRRVLVVESGPRHVMERLLPALDRNIPDLEQIDLLTCHAGAPHGFDATRGNIYHVQDYAGSAGRGKLFRELRARRPDICGLLCTGVPIMTAWKWLAAWHAPAKVFLVNEHADYFWFDRGNWRMVIRFALYRAGFGSGHASAHLAQIAVLPFTFTFLLLYAGQLHFRRWLRSL